MMKKILFALFALAGALIVYFISFWVVSLQVDIDLLKHANQQQEYSEYLGVYTLYYSEEPVYVLKNADQYNIVVHKIVEKQEDQYRIGYVVFVTGLNEEQFVFATTIHDLDDLTKLVVTNISLEEKVFDSSEVEEEQTPVSMTYGYQLYHGYFYNFYDIVENDDYRFELYNYQGNVFAEFQLTHDEALENSSSWNENDFEVYFGNDSTLVRGLSDEERYEIIRETTNMGQVYRNMAIYGVFVVAVGLLMFLKRNTSTAKTVVRTQK